MIFLKERISKLISDLEGLIYPKQQSIQNYKVYQSNERFTDIMHLDTSTWEDFSHHQIWGGNREYYWFETVITIPEEYEGECVIYELRTGREGTWDATNPQFTIYINGVLRQGLDVNHREVILAEKAVKGEKMRIVLSAFTGDQNFSLQLDSTIKVLDRKTEKYFYDLLVPYNVARLLRKEDQVYIEIITKINESLNKLDLRKPYSSDYYKSLKEAQYYITTEFYEKLSGKSEAIMYCVGHTHIDCAWLWTLAVTEDKVVRSFSTVLELMRQYPEYIFMSSQPQLYKYVKKNAPEVYKEIKKRVAEGRWEVEGGMFVEADCNISSGESLVRQFMHGKRFFKDEFGKDNKILWLPDVFGYSAALPQIMKKCDIDYFMTTKISWNEFNKMPYDTFEWEGIDGTRVLTHFISTRDYNKAAIEDGFETEHFTTYNGFINPSQVKGGWARYSQKYLNNEVLNSFGYGDGGGGPTKEMLENQRRLEKGIPGCPKTTMSTARQFFDTLSDHVKEHKYLPSWVGELYLEYHRGTYTSMARNKKYNRKSEFAYENAEFFGILHQVLNNGDYPKEQIHDGWEVILRNQFHDILPGSSIKEVYEDSQEEYIQILGDCKKITDEMLTTLTSHIKAPQYSVVVYNPNSFEGRGIVTFECPEMIKVPVLYDGDQIMEAQHMGDNQYAFFLTHVSPKGYKSFGIKEGEVKAKSTLQVSTSKMENDYVKIELNELGQIKSIYDKKAQREVLKRGQCANVIMTYEDRPHNYDAWDVNNYYVEKSWEVDEVDEITVVEEGPVRSGIKIVRTYLESKFIQYLYLYADSARIDIKNEIDWKENHLFVKTLFPVDIHTSEATFDIQYGNVKRPTHYNTSWDFARFEVCMHKWLDVSEDNYGLSVLNDCKYGASVHDGVIGISMLKSATYPNPDADKEFHEFTISLYPHTGDWKDAGTVQEAYRLNNPLIAQVKLNEDGELVPEFSLVKVDQDNVIIEVVKQAENSDEMIVRLYECYNRRTPVEISFYAPIVSIKECNLLEEEGDAVDYANQTAHFMIQPYEIKTFKVRLDH
ncbi:MAG: alpha-mannosidase [Cellulosilyticum sp.]|nr:alpha-mannosidase [Cellulosilyticum sp.]